MKGSKVCTEVDVASVLRSIGLKMRVGMRMGIGRGWSWECVTDLQSECLWFVDGDKSV